LRLKKPKLLPKRPLPKQRKRPPKPRPKLPKRLPLLQQVATTVVLHAQRPPRPASQPRARKSVRTIQVAVAKAVMTVVAVAS
jgi:hypothetical protein